LVVRDELDERLVAAEAVTSESDELAGVAAGITVSTSSAQG
jgi:hypothetical protein